MDGCRLLYAIIITSMLYCIVAEGILITYYNILVFFTNSLFHLLFLLWFLCLWGIFVVSVPLLLVGWTDSSGYYMVGWIGCFGYICPLSTPFTMLGHWSHQAFISLFKRVGLLQLTAEQWRAVTYFSDFWLHWWILVTGAMGQSIVRVVDWGTT